MNEALDLLEFGKVKRLFKEYTFSDGGKKHIDSLYPTVHPWDELYLVEEMLKTLRISDLPVNYDFNIGEILHKASMGSLLEPAEFLRLRSFLLGCQAMKDYGRKMDGSRLKSIMLSIKELPGLIHSIKSVVSEDGEVRDTASKKLQNLRTRKKEIISQLKRISERLKERYRPFLQDEMVIVRNGRYMLAVKSSHRPKVKGIVHHSSASGMTIYLEPEELVSLNDERKLLEEEERREVNRILRELTNEILASMKILKSNLSLISHIDSLRARALYAVKRRATIVHPSKDSEIKLINVRHPLIPADRVVPITVALPRNKKGLVITGPNMGGKTVTLKTIGLMTALAMAGFPIDVDEGSKIAFFEKLLVDIGEEQDIELSLSTFSSHIGRISLMLKEANESSLVLIDELGTGTDPVEGAALSLAVVEKLIEKGCKFVITTHMTPLKLYAIEREELESASVEFDPQTLKPTYRVLMGVPGASHAFEIASSLGIPRDVIERAKQHLAGGGVEVESVIRRLQEEVKRLEDERRKAQEEKERLERERMKYEREYKRLKDKKIEEIDRNLKELTSQVDEVMKQLEGAIHALKKRKSVDDLKRAVKELSEGKRVLKSVAIPGESSDIKVGDYVRIKDGTAHGRVVEDRGDKALVDFGKWKMEILKSSLVPTNPPKEPERVERTGFSKPLLEKPEIDIRGMTVEEAEPIIIDFIDRLVLSNFEKGYIIHGKGTGRLAAGVWEILRKDPRVRNYRFGMSGEGGTGVTIVEV